MLLRKWIVKPPLSRKERRGAIITLPGRGVPASFMLRFCQAMRLQRTLCAAIEPYRQTWYPMPNGPYDQYHACLGLAYATEFVQKEIEGFLQWQKLAPEQTVLLGFSAGSVVALQLVVSGNKTFAACVSHGGAILEPDKVQAAANKTPIILQHNKNDECFKWSERYVPMRESLLKNGYNVIRLERPFGPHMLYLDDAINVAGLIAPMLGYPKSFVDKHLSRNAGSN